MIYNTSIIIIQSAGGFMPKKAIHLILFDVISSFGSHIFSFACGFYILKHTDNAALFSIYLAMVTISTILSTPVFGTFTDTINNKRLITIAQLINVVSLVIFIFIYHSFFYYIIILAIILNLTDGAVENIISANMKHIAGDSIERFVSIFQGVGQVIRIISPIIGGICIAFVHIEVLAALNVVTELLAMIIIHFIPIKAVIEKENMPFWQNFKDGLHYLIGKRVILLSICFALVVNFLCNSVAVGIPIIVIQTLKLSSGQYGWIESTFMLSMLVAMIILSIFPIKKALKGATQVSFLLLFLAMFGLGFYLTHVQAKWFTFIVILSVVAVIGISVVICNVPNNIFMQKAVDDQYKGRVFALSGSIAQAMTPLSFIFFGFLLNDHQGWVYMITSIFVFFVLAAFSVVIKKEDYNI